MQNTTEKSSCSAEGLYKFFIYFVLVLLAVTIIVPVAWVFMASIKQNAEFYGNPWALPAGFYWQNFVNARNGAKMGEYMLNSVIVTALALVSSGFGACITPESASRLSLPNVLYRKIDIEPQPTVELACLYRRGDDNPVLHNFLDVIRHYKHQDI